MTLLTRYRSAILALVLLLAITACSPLAATPTPAPQTGTETEAPVVTTTPVESDPAATEVATTSGFPVTVEMCGEPVTFDAPPQRAVTNDVNITEIFLDVGLKDKLIGYSGVGDLRTVAPEYAEQLADVPLLSDQYIDLETLVGAAPDFFFAGWSYGFSEDKGITPESLKEYGIQSYVLTESCIRIQERDQVSLEDTFTDLLNIGKIFGVEAVAQEKVDGYRAELAEITETIGAVDEPIRVFVYDSGEESPFTAAKFAMPNAMIEAAGGTNIFNDVESSWTAVNWEDVVQRNPEYIVIVDYGEPNAEGKIAFLKSQPELADIDAIQNDRFVVITYAEATPGPRNVARTRTLAEAFYPEKFGTATAPTDTAAGFPVTIENCGISMTYNAPPTAAITMNQAATEVMLALGLEGSMAGTAYLDEDILEKYQAAYDTVPVISDEYPSQEVLFAAEPDFVYGAYSSAFGDEAAGAREELLEVGITSYLSEVACEDRALRPAVTNFEVVFQEIRNIGLIFGVSDRAETLIADMQAQLDAALAAVPADSEPVSIFWYDSGLDEPYVGACCGTPNMIIEAVGAENIFSDAEGTWATVSWEEVVARDPEVIVIIEAVWDPAQPKIDYLMNTPTYASIRAVQNERFIIIPFGATTLGVRNVDGVVQLAEALYPEMAQ